LATLATETATNLSPNSATVAENGDCAKFGNSLELQLTKSIILVGHGIFRTPFFVGSAMTNKKHVPVINRKAVTLMIHQLQQQNQW